MSTPGLSARLVCGFSASKCIDAGIPGQFQRDRIDLLRSIEFAYGTGGSPNQASVLYHVGGSIASSGTTDTYNLASGLTDRLGNAVTLSRVFALCLINLALPETANAPVLRLSGTNGAAALGSGYVEIGGGGIILHAAPDATGWPASGGQTNVLVKYQSGSGTAEYALGILGC